MSDNYLHADPGLFGRQARVGWHNDRRPPSSRISDYDYGDRYEERYEETAEYCSGPGGLYQQRTDDYDRVPGDLFEKIEDCPDCIGLIRNHVSNRKIYTIKEND